MLLDHGVIDDAHGGGNRPQARCAFATTPSITATADVDRARVATSRLCYVSLSRGRSGVGVGRA
eukprot:4859654-Pyramimonas_sp.AAC.1